MQHGWHAREAQLAHKNRCVESIVALLGFDHGLTLCIRRRERIENWEVAISNYEEKMHATRLTN